MENREQFVDFEKYCKTCKYKDTEEFKDPCNDCLDYPVNTYTDKPVNYIKRDEPVKKQNNIRKNIKK